jgi:hypothetical protein
LTRTLVLVGLLLGGVSLSDAAFLADDQTDTLAPEYSRALQSASPPIRAAFFYPWFPDTWGHGEHPPTNYAPTLGYYSSTDDAIIDQQIRLASGAHLQALIGSWWGREHATNRALQYIVTRSAQGGPPASDLRWAIYYEPEGQGDPSVDEIVQDLEYLQGTLFAQPNYLQVDARPVVFVYADPLDGPGMAERWEQAKTRLGGNLYVVLKVYPGYRESANQPDSWHQYSPAVPYSAQTPYAVTISPGFWKTGEEPRLARDPARFELDVRRMVDSGAAWQLVTTWNEWGEGSAVEPSDQFGSTYLDILCRALPGDVPCGTVSASAPAQPTAAPVTAMPVERPASPAAEARSVTVAAAGDIACGAASASASCRQMDTAALLADLGPDAILALGDTQYERGAYSDFVTSWDPAWGRFKDKVYPVPGNHEYLTADAAGYFDYFNGLGILTGRAGERGKGYYSFDLGAWHLVGLNSNCDKVDGCRAGSPQEQWLRADLAAHPAACSIMFMHHPLWSSDSREFRITALRPLVQAFYEAGGELILVGHSHFYERFAPQDPEGFADPARGVREIIVGTGGRNVYGFGPIWENSEVRGGRTFGVLMLTLNPTSYQWQFVAVPGESFTDSGRQDCH